MDAAQSSLPTRRSQGAVPLLLIDLGLWAFGFNAIGVGREALGALALLQQACEQESVTATFVHQVSAFLRRLEHDPSARFSQQ